MWSKGNGRVGHLRGTPRGVPWKCFPEMLIGLRVWIRKCKKFRSLCFGCLVRVNHLHKLLQRPSSKLFVAYLQVHILCVYAWTFVLPYLENIFNRDFSLWIYLEALYLVTTTYLPPCYDLNIQGWTIYIRSGVILAHWPPGGSMHCNKVRKVMCEGW